MAKKSRKGSDGSFQNTTGAETSTFTKGLIRDFDENFDPDSSWPYARNASNNSLEGDVGLLGNEPSNYLCSRVTFTIIGRIHLYNQYWIIFSTDNPVSKTSSEIGLYDEDLCTYRVIVNDTCLNFSTYNLITGVAKENFDCSWNVYFADGKNPDRVINIGLPDLWPNVPYVGSNYYQGNVLWPGVAWNQECRDENNVVLPGPPNYTPVGCTICTNLNTLNCDNIRINKLVKTPCINVDSGQNGGNLYNGSYFAVIAYTINEQKYGDYTSPSNVQYIFNHNAIGGSLDITLTNLETESFNEFELVVVSIIDQATVARKIGIYNTSSSITINLDNIDDSLPTVPLEFIPIRTPLYETSDSMFETGNYLLRIGPRTTFDFNYQPLANQIQAKWVVAKYSADYYRRGGYVTGYMRDEVYSFFIRWVYNTGEKSKSYHIPGRYRDSDSDLDLIPQPTSIYPADPGGSIELERRFEVENLATIDAGATTGYSTDDGGVVIKEGFMAYWESTEKYPDRMPEVWDATHDPVFSGTSDTRYDLCNKQIRHHKMPEDIVNNDASFTRATASGNNEATHINILGVKFNNIKPPVYYDESGTLRVVPGIVGYEILRGSREGNKSVIAKGIINNMRKYTTATGQPGLYANYPYNPVNNNYPGGASGILDPSLSKTPVDAAGNNYALVTENDVKKDFFTFHSPDTSFYKPYLSIKELRLYTELGASNNVTGQFEEVPGHPKHKLLTDMALITSLLVGLAEAVLALRGKNTTTGSVPQILNLGLGGSLPIGSAATGFLVVPGTMTNAINAPSLNLPPGTPGAGQLSDTTAAAILAANTTATVFGEITAATGLDLLNNILGVNANAARLLYGYYQGVLDPTLRGFIGSGKSLAAEDGKFAALPTALTAVGGAISLGNLTNIAAANNIELIYNFVKFRQYVFRYISHGILHRDNNLDPLNLVKRAYINESGYLSNQYNTFLNNRVNNLYRSSCVILNTDRLIRNPSINDTSIGTVSNNFSGGLAGWPEVRNNDPDDKPFTPFRTTASCYYVGTKVRFRNQYGQLNSIEQIPIPCPLTVKNGDPFTSADINKGISTPVLFGGDIYIGRYTEKNTFFYFSDWLYNQPDGTSFDYSLRYLGLYPKYWANFQTYDLDGLLGSIIGNLGDPTQWNTPANLNNLDDAGESDGGFSFSIRFGKRNACMYLFQSGVRDFYVESEINVAQRDWGELDEQKHYEVLSGLSELFNTRIIRAGNYFKIDPSLSVSNLFSNIISWGNVQDRDYNPVVSSLCYQYLSNRLIYSLPDTLETKKDYWRVFLPNNYKDFKSQLLAVRPIGKNGAMVFFKNDSPVMFQGTETLETDLGTKITIGDGALFSQPMQSIVNSDESYQYGSCQDKFSIINTPMGVYWMSQNQGKIMGMVGGMNEISSSGMRWWFGKFLPFRILADFPNFQLVDNPVAGVGCQSIYDNDFQLLYFCKKDYELRKDLPAGVTITYSGVGNVFELNGRTKIFLGDPRYFNDVSWTVSYDPKLQVWISFHDWHPNMSFPSKLNFITTDGRRLWRHNDTSQSYCNFYGVDYPFQVEYVLDSGQEVDTLKNIEYLLESYVYDIDGIDRFHVLDYNFDELVVYNTEQVSGQLNLNLAPKNNPFARLNYPSVNINSIDIAFEKVEQKFRVNQFWDTTADRGEFDPNVQRPIWLTEWDGYKRELNPANLNYNKSVFERKKFRHYYNNVLFTKRVSGNKKMLMKIANNKTLNSPR
jgi:hypothetical protein